MPPSYCVPLLPPIPDADAFRAVRAADIYRPALAEIARRHRLAGEPRRYAGGSLPVFAIGEKHVVKLFPPLFRRNRDNERDALSFLEDVLPVATPALRAADDIDGWPYLVMAQLPGRRMDEVWPELTRADHVRLAGELGELIAALHTLRVAGAEAVFANVVWDAFIAERRASCAEHQARRGADPAWIARIPDFLAAIDLSDAREPVFLHTEVMPDHLLVGADGHLCGLIDFEPSMIGAREYEFAAVGLFFARGDRELLRAALVPGGHQPDDALSLRLCGYALLHRYSHLAWYLERHPPAPGTTTFESLALQWFAL
jgi:hygromycin-B 7''-O-kinase